MKKKSSSLVIVVVAVIVAVLAFALPKLMSQKEEVSVSAEAGEKDVQNLSESEDLVIPLDKVTNNVTFYAVDVDGTEMEVMAVRNSSGNIRTAFNTCQICYSSGRGYYQQEGNDLVCQNCGNSFTTDQVGLESGGCNPVPIMDNDRKITDTSITISYDFLKNYKEIFAQWKTGF